MPILYGRKIIVTVAGLEITEPRIAVDLDRQIDRTQDKGTCTIFNLSAEHAQRIEERGDAIRIEAGYPETLAVLFEGQVQRVIRAREGLAHKTKIDLGDMVKARRTLSGTFNRVYRGPVAVREIARDIILDGLDLTPGPLDAIPEAATFNNFYWDGGPADAALTALLASVGCTYFEADGIVRVNCPGRTQGDAPTIRVTPETGLIGSPSRTDEGAEARMFLNGRVVLGCTLKIKAEALSGAWKVVGVRHQADNWSGKFETHCDLREIPTP